MKETHDVRFRRRHDVRDSACDVVIRCLASTTGADGALLLSRDGERTRVLSSWTRDDHEPTVRWTGTSLIGRALRSQRALVDRTRTEGGGDLVAAVAAPVYRPGRVLGAIYAGFSPPAEVQATTLTWKAESYARLAALCLGNDPTLAGVLGSTWFDVLTGCLSYDALMEVVKAETQRSQRTGHALSICFLDLDDFKRVNDEHGHLEGNRVLAAVGGALRQTARVYDAVGRFGGDEFVVVLPETATGAARVVAERMRSAIHAATSEVTSVPVDISIGVAEFDGRASPVELLAAADWALHEAKVRGGAQVMSPSSITPRTDGLLG